MSVENPRQHRRRPAESATSRSRAPRLSSGSRRSRGLTCANCRVRKVRCDGNQPSCKMCELYNDECRYDKPPPMSQLLSMAQRLQEAERNVSELRALVGRGTNEAGSSHIPATSATEALPQTSARSTSPEIYQAPLDDQMPLLDRFTGSTAVASAPIQTQDHNTAHSSPKAAPAPELTADENGNIRYYGPTSAVHEPPQTESPVFRRPSFGHSASEPADLRGALAVHALESEIWQEFALGNASLQTGIPRHIMARLLHIHWTWVAPMFLWVHRSAFIRDMATGGRYYSDFLLTVICAHAGKYDSNSAAEILHSRVRTLLGTAIQEPSSIPTVQALLQLSALHLAAGSISQAWVYSGIAFRMATDLGLQHVGTQIRGLSPVDSEVRRRLYWSCFFWDKATSLYTGRPPSVIEVLDQSSLDLLDTSADAELWKPYFGDTLNLTKLSHEQYPATPSYTVSCFINSCKLSIIINDIITKLYTRRSKGIVESSFKDIKDRLESWRARSRPHLRLDPDDLPPICPPPHIVSQNLLYFASVILTHRPFWSVPVYYQTCVQASQSIEKLVLLLESTFDLGNITYLMGYCIYTGASVSLEDAKKTQNPAHSTLHTFLRALNCGMQRCKLLERSLNIIIKEMSFSFAERRFSNDNPDQYDTNDLTNGYIPAFPYIDTGYQMDLGMNPAFGVADMSSMQVLDCYPEMQVDTSGIFGNLGLTNMGDQNALPPFTCN